MGRIRIEMMGLPGSGKTTLARQLAARLGARAFLERHDENPFLHGRFAARAAPSLENSLFFLLDELATQYASPTDPVTVYDSGLLLDLAYARATLPAQDAGLYGTLVQRFLELGFRASVVLDLHVTTDLAARRMSLRADGAASPTTPYLDSLASAIDAVGRTFAHSCALVSLDASQSPPAVADAAVRALVALFPELEARA